MTTTPMTDVEEALNAQLAAVAPGLGFDARLGVAWPNTEFTRPQTKAGPGQYLSVAFMPAPAVARSLDTGATASDDVSGVYQVTVHWPKGAGVTKPKQVADALAAAFPRGVPLVRNGTRVLRKGPAYVSAALEEDAYYSLPVTVPWRVLT